jgi:hypothetical protein
MNKVDVRNAKYLWNKEFLAEHWWLMPVILATQKVEIRRIVI